jgi:hypothetical protein
MTCRQPARTEAISEGVLKLSDLQLYGMRDAAQQWHTVDTFFATVRLRQTLRAVMFFLEARNFIKKRLACLVEVERIRDSDPLVPTQDFVLVASRRLIAGEQVAVDIQRLDVYF